MVVELTVVGLVVGCSGVLVAAVVLAQGEQNQAESAAPPTLLLNSQSTRTESQTNRLTIKQQKKAVLVKNVMTMIWSHSLQGLRVSRFRF